MPKIRIYCFLKKSKIMWGTGVSVTLSSQVLPMFKNIDLVIARTEGFSCQITDGCIRGWWPQVGLTARFGFAEKSVVRAELMSAKALIRFALQLTPQDPVSWPTPSPVLASVGDWAEQCTAWSV